MQKGTALLLHAHNFFKVSEELRFSDKNERFQNLMDLNERAKTKLIHVSLNFHPSEKERLTKEFYIDVADRYMDKIGMGNQPYLVYQHEDTGHPHIHVLAPLIMSDGKRIATHNIARNLSEPARKEIEHEFGLISADKKDREKQFSQEQLAVSPQRIQAGKSEVQRSITNVLDHVIDKYKFTSLNELNAILNLYNVKADSGVEGGRIHSFRGLNYVVIDVDGKALTKPIKASTFHNKPTLDLIEKKSEQNHKLREPYKQKVKTAIEWVFRSKPATFTELAKALKKERISLVVRRSEGGQIYGLTYVDHNYKTVFNGSDLGKDYSAKRVIERLNVQVTKDADKSNTLKRENLPDRQKNYGLDKDPAFENMTGRTMGKIIEHVVDPHGGDSDPVNKELLADKKRKKRKGLNLDHDM